MPRFRASRMLADMKQVTVSHYNCLTVIHADPFQIHSEKNLETMDKYPQNILLLSEDTSNFSIICLEDLLGNNKKIGDWDKELKSLLTHYGRVKENLPKGAHPATLEYLLRFDTPIINLRKQLQRETGYDPHDKNWHLKLSSTPLYETVKRTHFKNGEGSTAAPQEKSAPQEGYSLPYFMEPLNLRQELKECFLRLWKFVCSSELDFEQRVHASLIFGLDVELGKRYNKNLVDEYVAEFCLDKKKSREARAYRCKNRNRDSKESDDYKLLGEDPEFEERVRKLF